MNLQAKSRQALFKKGLYVNGWGALFFSISAKDIAAKNQWVFTTQFLSTQGMWSGWF